MMPFLRTSVAWPGCLPVTLAPARTTLLPADDVLLNGRRRSTGILPNVPVQRVLVLPGFLCYHLRYLSV